MSDHERGMVGAWLGLVIGVVYGLVSSVINGVVLWGVPIYIDPGQIIFNILASGLAMMATGYITARPYNSLRGVLVGALSIAAFQIALAFFNQSGDWTQRFGISYVLFISFLPLAALLIGVTAVLRLGVNWHQDAMLEVGRDRLMLLARTWGGAILVAVLVGSFAQYTLEEKEALQRVHTLVQQALTASEVTGPLATVDEFGQRAISDYTLSAVTGRGFDESGTTSEQFITIVTRFANGLTVQCLTGRTLGQLVCSEISP